MIKNIKKTFEVYYLTKLSLPRSPIIICFTVSRRTNQKYNCIYNIGMHYYTLIFGMLIVLYITNKNIEKFFLSRVGVLGSWEVKVTRSRQKITFLFIYIHLGYEYH